MADLGPHQPLPPKLTPGEEKEARAIARQLVESITTPSGKAVQLEYDSHVRLKVIGEERVSLALIELLNDPSPVTRTGAAIRLLRIKPGCEEAVTAILQMLESSDTDLQVGVASYLSTLRPMPAGLGRTLKALLHTEDKRLRTAVAALLVDAPESIPILGQALGSDDFELSLMAAKGLLKRKLRVDDALNRLIYLLGNACIPSPYNTIVDMAVVAEFARLPEKSHITGPIMMKLLIDPKTQGDIRTAAVSALGMIGQGAKAQAEFEQALTKSLRSASWDTVAASTLALKSLNIAPKKIVRILVELLVHPSDAARGMAAVTLAEFGRLASDAIEPLTERINAERSLDVLVVMIQAVRAIGWPDPSTDPSFDGRIITALVEQARSEENIDLLPYRIGVLALFGKRAIPCLIPLAQRKDLGSIRIAVNTLGMIGISYPEEVISQVIDNLITHNDERVRMTGTQVFHEMGSLAGNAVPQLSKLLVDATQDVCAEVLRVLGAIGPAALEAAPALIQLLLGEDQFLATWAEEVLIAIGADADDVLKEASARASGKKHQRLESLINRISVPNRRDRNEGEFSWVKDDRLLELFLAIGEILEKEGPTSYRALSRKLTTLKDQGYFTGNVDTSDRTIGAKIEKLEALFSEKEGRTILLTTREIKIKGGLTDDGRLYLDRIRNHFLH